MAKRKITVTPETLPIKYRGGRKIAPSAESVKSVKSEQGKVLVVSRKHGVVGGQG
jgi:hypothetical protein